MLVATLLLGLVLVTAGPAKAHEDRKVEDLELVVGWGDEPTYTGFKNSVQVMVSRDGEPVTDVGDGLRIEVSHGDVSTALPLEPNFVVGAFGEPGDYRAWLVPTRPGDYTFHFKGKIGGTRIDETFTSGPKTFSPVLDVSAIQFPAKDPSTGELAERLEREVDRLRAQIAAGDGDEAGAARALALAGAGVGVVALIALAVIGRRVVRPRA
jgi:hypothetical protein